MEVQSGRIVTNKQSLYSAAMLCMYVCMLRAMPCRFLSSILCQIHASFISRAFPRSSPLPSSVVQAKPVIVAATAFHQRHTQGSLYEDAQSSSLMSPKSIKPSKRIPNKRQAHLRQLAVLLIPRPHLIAHILLRNILNGEILGIDARLEFRFEGCRQAAQLVEVDAGEEGVLFDFGRAAVAAESVVGVANETRDLLVGLDYAQNAE